MPNTVPQVSRTNILQTQSKQMCPNLFPVMRTSAWGNTRYYALQRKTEMMTVEGAEAETRFCGVSCCCIPLESHGFGVVCMCPDTGRCSPLPPVAIALGFSVDARCCGSFQLKSSDCASQLENDHWNDSCFCFFGSEEKSLMVSYFVVLHAIWYYSHSSVIPNRNLTTDYFEYFPKQ